MHTGLVLAEISPFSTCHAKRRKKKKILQKVSVFARNPEPMADEHILRVLFISQLAIFPKLIVHDLTQVSAKLLCDLVQKLLHVLIVHRVCRVSGSAP